MVSADVVNFLYIAEATITEKQTVAFNLKAREDFKKKSRARMGVWQAIELLNTLVDDSDPDVRSFSRSFRVIITHTV